MRALCRTPFCFLYFAQSRYGGRWDITLLLLMLFVECLWALSLSLSTKNKRRERERDKNKKWVDLFEPPWKRVECWRGPTSALPLVPTLNWPSIFALSLIFIYYFIYWNNFFFLNFWRIKKIIKGIFLFFFVSVAFKYKRLWASEGACVYIGEANKNKRETKRAR